MCYTYIHPPYSSKGRSSVRHIITYGVLTPADITVSYSEHQNKDCIKNQRGRGRSIIWFQVFLLYTNECPCPIECPGYDTKQSDGKVPAMLELWGMRSTYAELNYLK